VRSAAIVTALFLALLLLALWFVWPPICVNPAKDLGAHSAAAGDW
jgi:hypothetical protein